MAYDLKATLKLTDEFTRPMRKAMDTFDNMNRQMSRMNDNWDRINRATSRTTGQMQNFGRESERSSGEVRNLNNRLNDAEDAASRLSRTAGDIRSPNIDTTRSQKSVFSLNGAFLAVTATIAGVVSGAKLLQETIGAAAKFESSEVLIEAMFNDDKASKEYIKMVDKMAKNSPVLNSDDMLANSKSFISLTKESELLGKAWGVVEKLNVLDPIQGIEGAVLAVRELAGGDVVSLAERFELPKKTLNDLKKLTFEEQVAGMEKLLAGMNITDDVIEKMGDTTISKWNQVKEAVAVAFRDIGKSANSEIGDALGKFNEFIDGGSFDKLAAIGDKILGKTFAGIIDGIEWSIQAFDKFQQSPAVAWLQTTLPLAFETVKGAITSALSSEGVGAIIEGFTGYLSKMRDYGQLARDFFIEMGPSVKTVFEDLWIILQPILSALGTALSVIGDIVLTVFKNIVLPTLTVAWGAFQLLWGIVSPILKLLGAGIQVTFSYLETVWLNYVKPILGWIGDKFQEASERAKPALDVISSLLDSLRDSIDRVMGRVTGLTDSFKNIKPPSWLISGATAVGEFFAPKYLDGSHATGLARVPKDNYTANLHKNEAILTASQANELRSLGALKSVGNKPVLDTGAISSQGTGRKISRDSGKKRATVTVGSIIINGAQKTTKDIVREIVSELEYAVSAGALE